MLERQSQPQVPYLQEMLLPAQAGDVLELDELWSFVGRKKNKVWIWIALCRRTRQVVAWHFGPRDEMSCRSMWDKIPPDYKALMCYSDFWDSYAKVIPAHQHHASGKDEGQTNHLPRGRPNASISPCASAWAALCERPSPFPNICSGISGICASSSSTTTTHSKENTPDHEPLPTHETQSENAWRLLFEFLVFVAKGNVFVLTGLNLSRA